MSLHPGTRTYNPAGNSDFTRKAEALAPGIANWSTPKTSDGTKGGPGQSYGVGGTMVDDTAGTRCQPSGCGSDSGPEGRQPLPGAR